MSNVYQSGLVNVRNKYTSQTKANCAKCLKSTGFTLRQISASLHIHQITAFRYTSPPERQAHYYQTRRARAKEYWKSRPRNPRDRSGEYNKRWKFQAPEKYAARLLYCREYIAKRRREDPEFRLLGNLRSRIREALLRGGHGKGFRSRHLIGCSIPEFREWIQERFTDGMSWGNYGEWEIDHVMPLARFDLSDPEQQKAAFHFTNTQPLWKSDNRRKADKIPSALTSPP